MAFFQAILLVGGGGSFSLSLAQPADPGVGCGRADRYRLSYSSVCVRMCIWRAAFTRACRVAVAVVHLAHADFSVFAPPCPALETQNINK